MVGDSDKKEAHFIFPWLAEIGSIQSENGQTAPSQVHPFHVFWAMPHRIRLDMGNLEPGCCDLCGCPSPGLIHRFYTCTHGLNYKGAWRHPLSPYKDEGEWWAVHPQSDGIGYNHWLPWVLGGNIKGKKIRRAQVLSYRSTPPDSRLWAFGFEMKKKGGVRCWHEATLPLYGLSDCDEDACRRLQAQVEYWLAGASSAVDSLRDAVKRAWFDKNKGKEKVRGDFSMVDASFWSRTEADFYAQLKALIGKLGVNGDVELDTFMQEIRIDWYKKLVSVCLDLFDKVFVGTGQICRQNPRRIAQAYRQLEGNLQGQEICSAFGVPTA
jgi:CRISPR system Cascade subunit CasA